MVLDGAWVVKENYGDPYRSAQAFMKKKRFAEAFPIYQDLARQGDPWAQVRVGWMLCEGVGVPRDAEKGRAWYQQAASLGSALAAFYCGREAGQREQWDEAIEWYLQAAHQEYGPALLWLGIVFLRGYGVPVDLQKAVSYFERGAATGNYYARRELAKLMCRGKLGLGRIPAGFGLLIRAIAESFVQFFSGKRDDRLLG